MEEEVQHYEYELAVTKQMFYNEDSMYGVYGFRFQNSEDEKTSGVELNPRWGNFSIAGNTPQLDEGETYTVVFEDHYTERYGDGYRFVEVKSDGLQSRKAQVEFLKAVLPHSIASGIDETFSQDKDLLDGIVSDRLDIMAVKGIGGKNIDRYIEAISQYTKYQEAILILSPLGVGVKQIKKLTDHFKGALALKQVIDENIYKLTEVSGFGFKRVDEFALKLGYDINSSARLKAGASYVLEQMSNYGDVKIPVEDFDREMCKILEVSEISDEIFEGILSSDEFYYDKGYISLSKLRDEESFISEKIINLLEKVEEIEGIEETTQQMIEKNEEEQGFKFNKEQIKAIELATQKGVAVINGRAGSGKSSSVKTIVDIFQEHDIFPVACALSGKAAQVLVQNGIYNSSTIHRMLKWSPDGGFTFNKNKPLPNKLIILDEASMVNNTLYVDILEAIEEGARFLIVGDNGQLPPIGHGAVFETLLKSDVPRVELVKVHRQAQKSGILTTANEIRDNQQINTYGTQGVQVIGDLKDMRVFNYVDKTVIYDDIMSTIVKFRDNPNKKNSDIQVLSAMKKGGLGVPKLNQGIQDLLNPHPDKGEKKPFVVVQGKELRLGDRVIQNGNFYEALGFNNLKEYKEYIHLEGDTGEKASVFNGTIGYIVEMNVNATGEIEGVLAEFESYDGNQLIYYHNTGETKEVGMLDLAYAITCHRSQGSGFKTVLFAFDYSAFMLLSKEFVYTGITRAVENCLMFVENTALHHAIKQTHSGNRKTYLSEFLKHNSQVNS